jgi:putative hemin transport protein
MVPVPAGEGLPGRWRALRDAEPGLRTRDAAARLGVSEAEHVATQVGETAVRLDEDAAALLHALPGLGRCMALTRNEHAVSEVRGRYGGVELGAHAGQVVGDEIDLRVFMGHWCSPAPAGS